MDQPQYKPDVWARLTSDQDLTADLPGNGRVYGRREVCESIRHDLTRLLNTRRLCVGWPDDFEELDRSLVNYGIADHTGANMLDASACEALRRGVEDAVRQFEPRLSSVSVTLPDGVDESSRSIRLRVNARLNVGGAHEHVGFESQLDPRLRRFQVKVADR